ncbi:MAG TPA: MFS transporter [Woeseiaceae bacterium]|nr:MFS transporter [Woeseiaceae bacterium]
MAETTSATLTDKVLGQLLGLERREYIAVAWSFAYFFCIMTSYFMLRPMRETMGVESGVKTIPILFSSTFVVMLLASPVFGWIASRYPRRRFLPWVYYFFALNILLFFALFTYADKNDLEIVWIGRAFFVWISVFNLFVVSVFWSFMADIYSKEQGRRLFGVISAGGSAGALTGPFVTSQLVVPLGFANLLPISAAFLVTGVFCIYQLRRWVQTEYSGETSSTVASQKPLGGSAIAGMTAIVRSKYFLTITLTSIIASLLGTALYMFMNDLVANSIEGVDQRTRLFSYIDAATGLFALIFQLLLVKHAVSKLGIGFTLALMPLVSLLGFALLAANPSLIAVAVFQAARRAIGFGFVKPSTDMLYSVVTLEEKYKAKNFIDTAVYRGSDLIGTWTVRLVWSLGISGIAVLLLPFALLWVLLSLWLGREYRRRDTLSGFSHASSE